MQCVTSPQKKCNSFVSNNIFCRKNEPLKMLVCVEIEEKWKASGLAVTSKELKHIIAMVTSGGGECSLI